MFKKLFLCFVLIGMVLSLSACGSSANTEQKSQDKLKVVVSFYAMKEFAEAIGKDKVNIQTIIPDGTEPHDFEPKANDLEKLSTAKMKGQVFCKFFSNLKRYPAIFCHSHCEFRH